MRLSAWGAPGSAAASAALAAGCCGAHSLGLQAPHPPPGPLRSCCPLELLICGPRRSGPGPAAGLCQNAIPEKIRIPERFSPDTVTAIRGYIYAHAAQLSARQPLTRGTTYPTTTDPHKRKWLYWTPQCGLMSVCRLILHKICKTLSKQLAFLAVKSSAVLWLFTNEQKKPRRQEAM